MIGLCRRLSRLDTEAQRRRPTISTMPDTVLAARLGELVARLLPDLPPDLRDVAAAWPRCEPQPARLLINWLRQSATECTAPATMGQH